jgi:histidine ammonia-lyase
VEPSGSVVVGRGASLSLGDVAAVAQGAPAVLSGEAAAAIAESRAVVESRLGRAAPVYGVNTGFGVLADRAIGAEDVARLQVNLVRSHAAGVGAALDRGAVRAMLLLRAHALALGASGVRPEVVARLLDLLAADLWPVVPAFGSVGASGDLAPLAHIALTLIGEGEARHGPQGPVRPAAELLAEAGLPPLSLTAKEGLALTNGSQLIAAVGSLAAVAADRVLASAELAAALTLQALRGIPAAFDPRLIALRPHPGASRVAARLRALLAGSRLTTRPGEVRVQDAYSLRAVPQVMGGVRDALAHVARVLTTEVNAATDNPVVLPDGGAPDGEVISGANFHGSPVALALDYLPVALAQAGAMSERRLERLVNPAYSGGLPPFLTESAGLHSGLMVAQYTAAAQVAQLRLLAHPASVDSIPTSAGQEDYVSMGPLSAHKARRAVAVLADVVAAELLAGAQAADLVGAAALSPPLAAVHAAIRRAIPPLAGDRSLAPDLSLLSAWVHDGVLVKAAEAAVGGPLTELDAAVAG